MKPKPEDYLHVAENLAWRVALKTDLPKDELHSEALVALVIVCNEYKEQGGPRSLRPFIIQRVSWRLLDYVRSVLGREGQKKGLVISKHLIEDFADDDVKYGFAIQPAENDTEAEALDSVEYDTVLAEIAKFRPVERDAVMTFVTGERLREVAARFDTTESNVSLLRKKALARLRERLAA